MRSAIATLLILGAVLGGVSPAGGESTFRIARSWEIGKVPAGFPVRFCLLTGTDRQYIAYYDEERRMTVASRALGSDEFTYKVLPTRVGWDSHNYITMALDGEGHLHVSGNMHCVPLIYFRTGVAGDIESLVPAEMTGRQEARVTYPKFLTDHEGRLLFNYRHGRSGSGVTIWNKYDPRTRTWSRLLDEPLLDGKGKTNAYPLGPVRGPDGCFHLVWVWRDTPDCATNHHLSHARSRDMVNWESAFGEKLELPITLGDRASWVDPIPSGGGIINGCQRLFFDREGRPVITYHKSDPDGHMQVYAARPEGGEWKCRVLTDWEKPVIFGGNGSMGFIGIRIGELSRVKPGLLTMTYRHRDYGRGRLFLDEGSLQPVEESIPVARELPAGFFRKQDAFEGMTVRTAPDIGGAPEDDVRYLLRWETLGANRDRPRKPPLPGPSTLMLYELRR